MATYVNDLRLKEIATGDSSGTWGSETNTNLELIAEALSYGTQDCFGSDANATTTVADGATDPARSIYFKVTSSATLSTTRELTIAPNTVSRLMFIENATTGSQIITIKQGSGATVNIGNGAVKAVYLDGAGSGAAVVDALVDLDLTGTTTAATLTASGVITGATLEATADTSSGDNAAIGFTSAEGIIITGQGSTNDVTIKNDADADVLTIATGGTSVDIVGDVTASTLNADGDTAAGDNASMGYTAAEGLILTGQGSTNDVTIKNDADADVLTIATGGTNVDVVGDLTAACFIPDGDTSSGDAAAIGYTAAEGLILTGQGSTNDVTIKNDADADVLTIATGGTSVDIVGDLTAGTLNADGDTSAGDNAAMGYTAAEGLILTGQGSTNDVTIKNDADADVIEIPTGTTNVTIAGTLDVGGAKAKVAGKETIYVPAAAMYPNSTAGCADLTQVELSNGPEIKCLDFDASSDENAQFTVCFPKSWNEGTVTFQAFWTVTGTNTGTVAWGLSGGSMADDASINTAFGTNVVATAKAFSGTSNDMTVSAESGAVTIANAAVDTMTYFQIMRDVSADSQSGDARLLGIKLFFTTDAANDA
tara:strand:+ start:2862 stop:4649 length:1788 start_codon:yes stop_codon:yes gene_type:complete